MFAPYPASDGRLFRCDVTATLSNGTLTNPTDDAASDDDWEEREASRTHSVKFSDPQEQDNKEVCTIIKKLTLLIKLTPLLIHSSDTICTTKYSTSS